MALPVPQSLPPENYYAFGQKSAALLGVLMTSEGRLTAFAYRRPSLDPTQPYADIELLYRSSELVLTQPETVTFRLAIDASHEGLMTLEPRGWTRVYEVQRTHFLGMLNPFSMGEIPYQDYGGVNRSGGFPSNRVFEATFAYNPGAPDPKQRATLTLVDVESQAQSLEVVSISCFDDPVNKIPGGLLLALRVNAAHYADGCARLEFCSTHQLDVTSASGITTKNLTTLVLNTTDRVI